MIIGMMRSTTGDNFTRAQIRSSIQRVDDLGLQQRREAFGRRIVRYLTFLSLVILIFTLYNIIVPYDFFFSETCRRVYNVPGPHHLRHNDGHHKLIRYGLITHGCVDGNTRTIIYIGEQLDWLLWTCVSII